MGECEAITSLFRAIRSRNPWPALLVGQPKSLSRSAAVRVLDEQFNCEKGNRNQAFRNSLQRGRRDRFRNPTTAAVRPGIRMRRSKTERWSHFALVELDESQHRSQAAVRENSGEAAIACQPSRIPKNNPLNSHATSFPGPSIGTIPTGEPDQTRDFSCTTSSKTLIV